MIYSQPLVIFRVYFSLIKQRYWAGMKLYDDIYIHFVTYHIMIGLNRMWGEALNSLSKSVVTSKFFEVNQ